MRSVRQCRVRGRGGLRSRATRTGSHGRPTSQPDLRLNLRQRSTPRHRLDHAGARDRLGEGLPTFLRGGRERPVARHFSSPNTPTPFVVPTYTFPFAMVGVMYLLPLPK